MMQKKKFLITGAAGFLGANLVERVVADGHSVLAMDNLSMGKLANLEGLLGRPGVEFLQADVTQASAFEKVAGDYDVIVHLAAFKIPRYGKAIDTLKINYQGTENALEYARRTGCKAVLASTSDVYGRNPKLPFSEEGSDSVIGSSKSPRWAYAVSKLFDEHLASRLRGRVRLPGDHPALLRLLRPAPASFVVGGPAVGVHRLRAERQADPGARRRHADAQLHLRHRHGRRHLPVDDPRPRPMARSSTSATRRKSRFSSWRRRSSGSRARPAS